MESNLCLYDAMQANGLLDNMTPAQARQYYGSKVESFITEALHTDKVPPNEVLTGKNSMGSISILQVYLREHPDLCFLILYADQKSFILYGNHSPAQVYAFRHVGNVDSGHFIAHHLTLDEREKTLKYAVDDYANKNK